MTDPVGPIAHSGVASSRCAAVRPSEVCDVRTESLVASAQRSIDCARELGAEAERTVAAMRSGAGTDVEGVLLATRQADAAFRMLEAARNAMLEAYARMDGLR